jgi:hypothetical protein
MRVPHPASPRSATLPINGRDMNTHALIPPLYGEGSREAARVGNSDIGAKA